MADYIRRDIVLKIINTVNDTGGFAGYADYCVLFDEIDTMPASDVQPVRHGRWSECYTDSRLYSGICTVCGKASIRSIKENPLEYCPKCGARMDGDVE